MERLLENLKARIIGKLYVCKCRNDNFYEIVKIIEKEFDKVIKE